MLQKIFGCTLISKLHLIVVNAVNKRIHGVKMMENVRRYRLLPEEIYSERNKLADDGTLSKILFYEIIRQLRRPAGLASVNADNCYNRIAHPIASIAFQAFGIPTPAIESMLTTIQDMKFHLHTGYGDSKDFAGGHQPNEIDPIKAQGMCQGNGASPATWTVTAITIINAHKQKQYGDHLVTPISKDIGHLVGNIYVDDTDLIHLDMRQLETIEQAHKRFQASIQNWGKLLLATGGALKPSKCLYYLISFLWRPDGTWVYNKNENNISLSLRIPMSDGSSEEISHMPVNEAVKTLGSMTCPTGCNTVALNRMVSQGQEWADKVKSSYLSRRSIWFMLDHQLWPRISYGICNNTVHWEELSNVMRKVWYQIISKGGIRNSASVQIRQLDQGFYGAGFPHPGVECFASQIQKFLTHYGCKSAIGLQLQVSLNLFIIELGLTPQPFSALYKRFKG
jgi:hypothetical protein